MLLINTILVISVIGSNNFPRHEPCKHRQIVISNNAPWAAQTIFDFSSLSKATLLFDWYVVYMIIWGGGLLLLHHYD